MAGWTWCVIGLVLFVAELFIPSGFFLLVLGIAGILVGLIMLTGIPLGWALQTVVFCVIAIALWVLLAGRLQKAISRKTPSTEGTDGKVVKVLAPIAPGEIGSGELWGSTWRIKNVGLVPLTVGLEVVVVHSEGVTLHVRELPVRE